MKLGVEILLWAAAALGHAALWVALVNRLNSFGCNQRLMHRLNRWMLLATTVLPLVVLADQSRHGWVISVTLQPTAVGPVFLPSTCYLYVCWLAAAVAIVGWFVRQTQRRSPRALLRQASRVVDLSANHSDDELAVSPRAKALQRVPGNQIFQLQVDELHLALMRLPDALEGLSICHLSDFHMAGHISRSYHEAVVEQANQLNADLVLVTGDIVDTEECLSWLPATLGRLTSRVGRFFILGNHELRLSRVDTARRRLEELGLTNLGGTSWPMQIDDVRVLLAGNEAPWLTAPPTISPRNDDDPALRLLLSHSPDQIAWARQNDFDLMLAGHTHGGQFCLPGLGPVVCPSWHGVAYASGLFFRSPTLLHVSRGISGMMPLRLNCPPQITKLVLHRAS